MQEQVNVHLATHLASLTVSAQQQRHDQQELRDTLIPMLEAAANLGESELSLPAHAHLWLVYKILFHRAYLVDECGLMVRGERGSSEIVLSWAHYITK